MKTQPPPPVTLESIAQQIETLSEVVAGLVSMTRQCLDETAALHEALRPHNLAQRLKAANDVS